MSNTPVQEPPAREVSSGSGQTLPSRHFQPIPDPSASKRVCFFKSGDYKFSGHRMVVNSRTFKTFDALLDALSKKVPLPFGVRTITTPRGTHLVKALDDLHDGGSYVCSDQRRVKPLNLEEVNRRQVPWNTTRPFSAGRRKRQVLQVGRRNEEANRPAKVTERVAVRTPKKLVVINNRDPTVKRTIVLQRRTAPTFNTLLDYLSQILQFPVLKLFATDGRRVDGLAALILCSGVVVAAGNEPFRLGNYSFHRTGQMAQMMYMETVEPSMLQPIAQNNKSISSGRGSRNFSQSSERYIIDQVNKSRNGTVNGHPHHQSGSFETEINHQRTSAETRGTVKVGNERHALIVPQEDDIEKSFRVNQDGSMTVEMKVHLTIKEEEILHWTTTVSRSSLSKGTVCSSISESGRSSPDSNNAFAKDSSSLSEDDTKEENHPAGAGKGVGFNDEQVYKSYNSTTLGKAKTGFKRTPTPGPQRVSKKASVESVKTVTETGVQESTLGHYSYMERTADGETTEGYCVVRHSSSSNTKPIPKPRKTASAGANKKGSHSSIRSSGLAEVLQIENNGMEVRETVMHIYESQGCYDNYYANEEYSADGAAAPESKPSTVPSSNDIDFSTTDSLQRQKEEMLSLSSEPITHKLTTASNSQIQGTENKDKTPRSDKKKKMVHPSRNQKSSTSSSDKKQKESPSKQSKRSSTDKLRSNASAGKKSLTSSESANSGQKSRGAEKPQSQKVRKDEKTPRKEQALLASTENLRRTQSLRHNLNEAASKDNGHNVNSPTGRPQMKKNMLDILQPKKSMLPGKKTKSKPKSMIENRASTPKKSSELGESFSMPSLNPSPSEIHQYVENWLEKAEPDSAPYTEEDIAVVSEPQTKVVFQIGGDSESDETNGCHTSPDEENPPPADAVKKSASCLSVPHCHAAPATSLLHNEQYERGLCVSMPSVRVDPGHQENRVRAHKSAEAIGPAANQSASPESNALSPKARIRPVLQQLCSSVQCIRNVSETSATSNLEKSNSLPDFPTQVASVFGSSCKAFLSFLSVMTLRDNLTPDQSRSDSEAKFMMESLQKISVIEDEVEQRASLRDLQSRASSQLREHWKDFQILRERLESEPLSPRVSETEFALDVVSEGGDVFEDQHMVIDELMEELNMPQDLREQISSTIQQARSFYPVDESTFVEIEKDQSETDEDVEKFVEECETLEPDTTCTAEGIIQTKQVADDDGQQGMLNESEQVADKVQEMGIDVKESEMSQTDRDEPLEEKENAEEQAEEDDSEPKEIDDGGVGEETEIGENESEEEAEQDAVTEEIMGDNGQEEWEEEEKGNEEETVDKAGEGTEGEMTVDEEGEAEESDFGEKEVVEEIDEGILDDDDQEPREEDSVEDTDEREGVEEMEEEERGEDEVVEEADVVTGETDEGEGVDNIEEEEEEEEEEVTLTEDAEDESEEENEEEETAEVIEEREEEEEVENVIEEMEEEEEEEEEEEDTFIEDADEEAEEGVEEQEEEEMAEVIEEREKEEEVENVIEEMDEEEEEEEEEDTFIEDAEEEAEEGVVEQEEEEMAEDVEEREEEEEVENVIEEMEEEEEEEDTFIEDADEEAEEDIEEEEEMTEVTEEKEEVENVIEEMGEEEEEKDVVTGKHVEDAVVEEEGGEMEEVIEEEAEEEKDEEEEETEVVGGESNEEEEEREQAEVEDGEDVEVKIEDSVITDGEEEEQEADKTIDEEECDEGGECRKESSFEEESAEEKEVMEEAELAIEQKLNKGVRGDDEENESNEFTDRSDEMEEREIEEEKVSDDKGSIAGNADSKILLEEALYLQEQSSCEEEANVDANVENQDTESPTRQSSEGQCEDEKGNGTDTVHELETDEERRSSLPHPVEISQELLDFVNSALQSSSLIFTYDAQGKIRIEPENARVVQTKTVIPRSREDSSYGLKRLPSPITSDLSDYRPETSESGGYKSQDSVDIVTESGDSASEKPPLTCRRKADIPSGAANVEQGDSELSSGSHSEALHDSRLKTGGSFSSLDSGTKASREDLSYFSGASSQKADNEAAPEAAQCASLASEKDSTDGVLIDRGRWLLKENHLIRKSPPVSLGMYGNVDSTSSDTGQENLSEDSPTHCKAQPNPLAAISSSELEEMAKPQTPKCTYYNMPHGSDSDPFMDDSSYKSGKRDLSSVRGRGVRVSPTIDTSRTWASKNGSMSSFASVEFKVADRKVHPEGESSAVTRARRTSSGGGHVLQAQDSLDTLHVRCGQYCPIL